MRSELVLLVGIPGSGKSTYAKKLTAARSHYRVNKDDLRAMLGIIEFSRDSEVVVVEFERLLVRNLLKQGHSVVVDNTHLSEDHRRFYRKLANDLDVTYREEVMSDSHDLALCVQRVIERNKMPCGHYVPLHVVSNMHAKFINQFDRGEE